MQRAYAVDFRSPVTRAGRLRERLWRDWCFARVVLQQFVWRFVLLAAVLLSGTLLFWKFEGHAPTKALYFTWSLVTGQPPESFPAHWPLQAAFFVVPVLGMLVILESIVEFALLLRDRRRQERSWHLMMAKHLSDHVLLVGLGRLGYRTYTVLRRLGEAVVIIERNDKNQFLDELRREGVPVLLGDARDDQLLIEANVAKAKSIVLATTDDLANLEAALDARRYNPNIRVVLRMFDPKMADKVREGFNIQLSMSQSGIAAPAFATAALDRTIEGSAVVNHELVVMKRWVVSADGPLAGRTVLDVMEQFSVNAVEHRTAAGAVHLFPKPQTRLAGGDELLVQGLYQSLKALG